MWGTGLFVLSWAIYLHMMIVPGLIDRAGRFKGSDYVQFYVMGSMVLDGRTSDLYDPNAHLAEGRRHIEPDLQLYASHPNYGPQVALVFAPLALLPYGWSLALFLVINALCYGASVWIIRRECPGLLSGGAIVAILAGASPLLFALLRFGQASAFALLVWSLAFLALNRSRPFLAGLAIGCLIYKPQLGIVIAIVMIAARQGRVIAGAATMILAQLGVAWYAVGWPTMARYFKELWILMRDPGLVEIFPSEVHSLRGFVQLLVPSQPLITACYVAGLAVILVVAARCWSSTAPVRMRVAQMVVLTILASPHLMTYDLVLLTLPLIVFADWIVRHRNHALRPLMTALTALAYFAPFSGLLARHVPFQASVVILAGLAWMVYSLSTDVFRLEAASSTA